MAVDLGPDYIPLPSTFLLLWTESNVLLQSLERTEALTTAVRRSCQTSPLHAGAAHGDLTGAQSVTELGGHGQQPSARRVAAAVSWLRRFCVNEGLHQPTQLVHRVNGANKLNRAVQKCIRGVFTPSLVQTLTILYPMSKHNNLHNSNCHTLTAI